MATGLDFYTLHLQWFWFTFNCCVLCFHILKYFGSYCWQHWCHISKQMQLYGSQLIFVSFFKLYTDEPTWTTVRPKLRPQLKLMLAETLPSRISSNWCILILYTFQQLHLVFSSCVRFQPVSSFLGVIFPPGPDWLSLDMKGLSSWWSLWSSATGEMYIKYNGRINIKYKW